MQDQAVPGAAEQSTQRKTWVRRVAGWRYVVRPLAHWNSPSGLKSSKMLRKAASVAKNSCKQKSSAARACFSSAMRFSMSALQL